MPMCAMEWGGGVIVVRKKKKSEGVACVYRN
jgi:hypothetical protein